MRHRHSRGARATALSLISVLLFTLLGGCGGGNPVNPPAATSGIVTTGASATSAAAAALGVGDGAAWQDSQSLTVPADSAFLFVSSCADQAGANLTGASVRLTSPSGERTITLGEGALAAAGFTEADLASVTTDPALEAYADSIAGELPAQPSDDDVAELLSRLKNGDPEGTLPGLPDGLADQVDTYRETIDGLTNAIPASDTPPGPTDGLLVVGPEAGTWTIEVDAEASAGAFLVLAWAVPADAEGLGIDAMSQGLAGAATAAGVRAGPAGPRYLGADGGDPGCVQCMNQFKSPAAYTAEWFRAKAIGAVWFCLKWAQMRALFTKFIDYMFAIVNPTVMSAIGLTAAGLKEKAILTGVIVWNLLKIVPQKAEEVFWQYAFVMQSAENYCMVCYLGLKTPYEGGLLKRYNINPPVIVMEPDYTLTVELCAFNIAKDALEPPAYWGFGGGEHGAGHGSATWALTPSSVATLTPSGVHNSQCTIKSPNEPEILAARIEVTLGSQPALGHFGLNIEEPEKQYTVHGQGGASSGFGVDDNLDILKGTQVLYTTGYGMSGTKGPAVFKAKKGDVLTFQVRDTYGHCSGLQAIYISDEAGHTDLVHETWDQGCGHGGGDRGVQLTFTYTVPF